MGEYWRFSGPGVLYFGQGCVREMGPAFRERGWQRVLVITDEKLQAAGVVEPVQAALEGFKVNVFNGGRPEPSIELVDRCLAVAHEFRPDVLVGVGGGSNMDLAKSTALLLQHGGGIWDYVGDSKVPGPIRPVVGVPTTAGTGSEVSCAAVLTDTDQQMKVAILSPYLRPRCAFVDPTLTRTCPPSVTADSGIDALTHAIEAYTAIDNRRFQPAEPTVYQGTFPLADLLAEEAIRLVGKYLVRAVENGEDMEARSHMALAATLAGLAFSNACVGIVHALEYPVGGAVHCPHGRGNGILLPHVMRFNLAARQDRMARIARLLGAADEATPEAEAAERAVQAVEAIRDAIGLPARLRDVGVRREQLPEFAAKAYAIKRLMQLNPRPVRGPDILKIYEAAF